MPKQLGLVQPLAQEPSQALLLVLVLLQEQPLELLLALQAWVPPSLALQASVLLSQALA